MNYEEILQALYDLFHGEMRREEMQADELADQAGPSCYMAYARANAYTNARDAVMRAAHYTLEPAQ